MRARARARARARERERERERETDRELQLRTLLLSSHPGISTTRKSLSLESTASQRPTDAATAAATAAVGLAAARSVPLTPATAATPSRHPCVAPSSPRSFSRPPLSPSGVGDGNGGNDNDDDDDDDDLWQAAASSGSASRSAALATKNGDKESSRRAASRPYPRTRDLDPWAFRIWRSYWDAKTTTSAGGMQQQDVPTTAVLAALPAPIAQEQPEPPRPPSLCVEERHSTLFFLLSSKQRPRLSEEYILRVQQKQRTTDRNGSFKRPSSHPTREDRDRTQTQQHKLPIFVLLPRPNT